MYVLFLPETGDLHEREKEKACIINSITLTPHRYCSTPPISLFVTPLNNCHSVLLLCSPPQLPPSPTPPRSPAAGFFGQALPYFNTLPDKHLLIIIINTNVLFVNTDKVNTTVLLLMLISWVARLISVYT